MIISFTMILTSIGMEWLYKALEQYTYITVRSVVFKLIALIATFLLIHKEADYIIYGFISIFAGAVVDVVFNALLIPGYGVAGAAFGAVMAEISVFIVQFTAVKKEVDYFSIKFIIWILLLE